MIDLKNKIKFLVWNYYLLFLFLHQDKVDNNGNY